MKKLFATFLFTAFMLGAMAQSNDPVIFQINGKDYRQSQFLKEYYRSIGKNPSEVTATPAERRKDIMDYAQLYVNFQTKLTDAYALGYDTLPELNRELSVYRTELAAPYLIDSTTLQNLLREAYERNHYVLHAAHILVPCPENSLPADTLEAYNHAMEIYNQALLATDFYLVAQQEMKRQRLNDRDPLVRQKADQVNPFEGDLGCFTVFDMIYPFETAVYNMTPGEICKPVRTRYGYHIIKLFDRFEYYGKSQVAHIWISESDPSSRGKINDAYRRLQEGIPFETVAKDLSQDPSSSSNGGLLPELPPNQLPVDYVSQISRGLKEGEYSRPFHTRFGWHILKLIKKETMPDFESMIPYYKSRMTRGERATKPKHIFIEQCKDKYGFVDYTTVKTSKKKNAPYAASLQAVRSLISDSIFSAIFHYDSNQITDMRPLFKIGDKEFNSRNFARYIYKNRKVYPICDLDLFLVELYNNFIDAKVLEYADSRLEKDIPEFGELIEEYRHGLMIFTYNDRMVWGKALKDTLGFENFYTLASPKHRFDNPDDAVYFWNERAVVNTITVSDSTLLPKKKALKVVAKGQKKGWDREKMADEMCKKVRTKKEYTVGTSPMVLEKGNQEVLSEQEWKKGTYVHNLDSSSYEILMVERIAPPELKSREEARGFYLNDYQNYLEDQNNAFLRTKYHVIIYQDVLDKISF